MALTPLLASASCGIFDFRIAEEPVRRLKNEITKYQVLVESMDLENKTLRCIPAIGSNGDARPATDDGLGPCGNGEGGVDVEYDKLTLTPRSETNTFNTPGVLEHFYTMRSVNDAVKLRGRVPDCFELAPLPTVSNKQKLGILHSIIIGAGPTGIELAAEIDELVSQHLLHIPRSRGFHHSLRLDVADKPFSMFSGKLLEYASERFKRWDVRMCMGTKIEGFERGIMKMKGEGEVGFGLAVWAAGNKACRLVEVLKVRKTVGGMERVVTDEWLRVLRSKESDSESGNENEGKEEGKEKEEHINPSDMIPSLYALGDVADIINSSLPETAEVAVQKAKWLAKHLIVSSIHPGHQEKYTKPFKYQQKALVAYVGRGGGVIEGKSDWTGASAWLAWRSGSLEWTRSWRRRVMIVLVWVMNKVDGREVARR